MNCNIVGIVTDIGLTVLGVFCLSQKNNKVSNNVPCRSAKGRSKGSALQSKTSKSHPDVVVVVVVVGAAVAVVAFVLVSVDVGAVVAVASEEYRISPRKAEEFSGFQPWRSLVSTPLGRHIV